MVNRIAAGALLVVGGGVGYTVRGTTVAAQISAAPIAIGEKVTFIYQHFAADRDAPSVRCEVAELRGDYVRCAPEQRIGGALNAERERWINLEFVRQITKEK